MTDHRFILGTVQFGLRYGINNMDGKPSKDAMFHMLHFAHEQGIRQLDTAEGYGDAQASIGDYISSTKQIFDINTKFTVHQAKPLQQQLDHSLQQLKVNQIHVYFYHRADDLKNYRETLDELCLLKEKKLIAKIGVSIYTNEEFELCIANKEIDVIQFPFNLLDNFSRRGSFIEKAIKHKKQLQVRSVFLQGLFFKEPNAFPDILRPLSKYIFQVTELAGAYKMSVRDLALGYVWNKSGLNHIIIGVDSKEQLEQNLAVKDICFSEQLVKEIDSIVVQEELLLSPNNWK